MGRITVTDIQRSLRQENELRKKTTKPKGAQNNRAATKTDICISPQVNATIVSGQGPRAFMQDRYCATTVAASSLLTQENVVVALDNTAAALSTGLKFHSGSQLAGTTATVCVIHNNVIHTQQIGDSFALVYNKRKQFHRLNRLHHPSFGSENGRIYPHISKSKTGNIFVDDKDHGYMLSMSRTYGSGVFSTAGVNSESDIYTMEIDEQYDHLLIASDGLHEVMSDQEIVDYLSTHTIDELRDYAYQAGCTDNILIVSLPIQKGIVAKDQAVIVGVFDGHDLIETQNNGAQIAEFLAKELPLQFATQAHLTLLPELQKAIDIAKEQQQHQLSQKLIELQTNVLREIVDGNQAIHVFYQQLSNDIRCMLADVFYVKKDKGYASKIYAVDKFKKKTLEYTKWQYCCKTPVIIWSIIGAIIGLVVGAIVGALCTPELCGMGALPAAVAGAIEGASWGALAGGLGFHYCAKKIHYQYLSYKEKDLSIEAATCNAIDEVITHHQGFIKSARV